MELYCECKYFSVECNLGFWKSIVIHFSCVISVFYRLLVRMEDDLGIDFAVQAPAEFTIDLRSHRSSKKFCITLSGLVTQRTDEKVTLAVVGKQRHRVLD